MTAVIHHGPPGSFKTFSLVQRILIPALQQGRPVITNIRGFNDLDRIRSLGIELPEGAAIYYLEPNNEGYETMARFFHWAPAGALICMDEGQRVYPMRVKTFGHFDQPDNIPIVDVDGQPLIDTEGRVVARPSTLENAFDQHRHYNWDIYISTTNIGKVHGEIRRVVEWAYRHRNNSGLLPWYKDTWTEFRHDAEQSGKSISHYSGAPKRYKADQKFFGAYQSTATGKAKGSSENISIFRDPKLRALALVLLLSLAYVGYNLTAAIDRFRASASPASEMGVSTAPTEPGPAAAVPGGGDHSGYSRTHRVPVAGDLAAAPFAEAKLYFTGYTSKRDVWFEVHYSDDTFIAINSVDLARLGYLVVGLYQSFVTLDYRGHRLNVFSMPQAVALPPESDYGAAGGNALADGLSDGLPDVIKVGG